MRKSEQWPDLVMSYLGFKGLDYPFTFKTRDKQQIVLETFHDLVTIWVIFFRQEYKVPSDCKVIIDAGANIGSFSIYASNEAPNAQIFALEPFPSTLKSFESNLKLNQLDQKVKVIKKALADQPGERYMNLEEDTPSQSIGIQKEGSKEGLCVITTTLSHLMEDEKIGHIDLLKIDVEGAEHEVLPTTSGDVYQKIENICLEYHPNGSRQKLFELLESQSFQLVYDLRNSENSGVAWFKKKVA